MSDTDVKSPCISVCWLNEEDVCEGCYRSAEEITVWSTSTPEQKQRILKQVGERRKVMNNHGLL